MEYPRLGNMPAVIDSRDLAVAHLLLASNALYPKAE
jgi:hypothetical protein